MGFHQGSVDRGRRRSRRGKPSTPRSSTVGWWAAHRSWRGSTGCWPRPPTAAPRRSSSRARAGSGRRRCSAPRGRGQSASRPSPLAGSRRNRRGRTAPCWNCSARSGAHLAEVPEGQATALASALGWTAAPTSGDRFLVAAGTLALLAAAAEHEPVLVLVDDVQWIDAESAGALLFAARRMHSDRVAFVLAQRPGSPHALDGLDVLRVPELSAGSGCGTPRTAGHRRRRRAAHRADRQEPARPARGGRPPGPGPAQRDGAAARRPPARRRAVRHLRARPRRPLPRRAHRRRRPRRLPARAGEPRGHGARPVRRRGGRRPGRGGTRRRGRARRRRPDLPAPAAADGGLVRRHPRRAAGRARAPWPTRPATATTPRGSGTDRRRRPDATTRWPANSSPWPRPSARAPGFAASSLVLERAASLTTDAATSVDRLAAAVSDAFLSGDVGRTRALADRVLAEGGGAPARAAALLALGRLEEHTGSIPAARDLLGEAAELAEGPARTRGAGRARPGAAPARRRGGPGADGGADGRHRRGTPRHRPWPTGSGAPRCPTSARWSRAAPCCGARGIAWSPTRPSATSRGCCPSSCSRSPCSGTSETPCRTWSADSGSPVSAAPSGSWSPCCR